MEDEGEKKGIFGSQDCFRCRMPHPCEEHAAARVHSVPSAPSLPPIAPVSAPAIWQYIFLKKEYS
jgi:hypothetical protein